MTISVNPGDEFRCRYPFVRAEFEYADEEWAGAIPTWNPGIRYEAVGPEDSEAVADGEGEVIFTVIDVHKLPRPYPTRVFYTRRYVRPDGKEFGRSKKLHITTLDAFRRRAAGFMHEYVVESADAPA